MAARRHVLRAARALEEASHYFHFYCRAFAQDMSFHAAFRYRLMYHFRDMERLMLCDEPPRSPRHAKTHRAPARHFMSILRFHTPRADWPLPRFHDNALNS